MLGKTAGGLFWMFRYLERSENTARLIEAGQHIALTQPASFGDEWASVLKSAGSYASYVNHHGEDILHDRAIAWMLRSRDNPFSILNMAAAARENAKLVRTALTREVWEAVNENWLTLRDALARKVSERDLPDVLALIRQRSAYVRGALNGTMLRNEIYDFARIGTFLERADNTARILDVKYYVLLPSVVSVGTSIDNVQWQTILRSVSAEGGFHMTYGRDARPREIAQFLILDKRMPRSLAFCVHKLQENFYYLYTGSESHLLCHDLCDQLESHTTSRTIDEIFDSGLHEFITNFLQSLNKLGSQTEIDYRFYN